MFWVLEKKKHFPNSLSDSKLKEGIFIGQQIRECVRQVCCNFFGNVIAENYKELVKNLVKCYQCMRGNMTLKIHFLYSHFDFIVFPLTWARLVKNATRDFTRIFLSWRNDMQENRYRTC